MLHVLSRSGVGEFLLLLEKGASVIVQATLSDEYVSFQAIWSNDPSLLTFSSEKVIS